MKKFLLFLFLVAAAHGESLSEAIAKAQADMDREVTTLRDLRQNIAAERIPLAQQRAELEAKLREQRAKAERLERAESDNQREREAAAYALRAMEQDVAYLQTLFSDNARSMETRVNPAEAAALVEALDRVDEGLRAPAGSEDWREAVTGMLALQGEWTGKRFGGHQLKGAAVDAEGIEQQGAVVSLGPLALFASEAGDAGIVLSQRGTAGAAYHRVEPEAQEAIRAATRGEAAVVTLDVSNGDALKVEQARAGFWEEIQKGGKVVYPLLAIGFLATVLALWKALSLAGQRAVAPVRVEEIAQAHLAGDGKNVEELVRSLPRPLRDLIAEGVAHASLSREHLEEILHERVSAFLPRLEQHLGTLAVFAGVAPLLGLLGTVTGMIHTFQLVTLFGSGDPSLLSGGISEALVTTKVGLAIAIPVLLVHAFLVRRVRSIIAGLEQSAMALINHLKVRN